MPTSKPSNKIAYRIHETRQTILLAACDKELIGKTFKGANHEFFVNPRFYSKKETDEEKIKKIMKDCSAGNLVGKNTVEAAKAIGMISEENIIYFENVPHAQYVIMRI